MSNNYRIAIWLAPFILICTAMASTEVVNNAEQVRAVLALEGDKEFGAYLSGECLTCHTPTGDNQEFPLIHGKEKEYLVSALLEYKNGQRENDVMRGVTAAMSNEEIAAIVAYLNEQ